MTARNEILDSIRASRPPHVVLPSPRGSMSDRGSLVESFSRQLEAVGGECVVVSGKAELRSAVEALSHGHESFVSTVGGLRIGESLVSQLDIPALALIEMAVVPGRLGVAENGAVWLCEDDLGQRVLSVVVESLVVVIDSSEIVNDMHAAYSRLRSDVPAFGQFVAGPSKTADIEQALVIGAHGAKKTTVIVTT